MAPKSKSKSKSKKPAPVIKPEFELPPPGSEPPRKKKKKNAPDRPQPEWMFPADEDNPVLNPKPKSEAQILKNEKDRDDAIKFLKYRSVSAPMKAPPPDLLLTLVGAFLSSYGFNNTSRLYTTQVQSRKKLDAWKIEIGAQLPKGFPDLVKIFKEWYKGYQEKSRVEETSSSDTDDSDDTKAAKKSRKAKKAKTERKAEAKAREDEAAKVLAKDMTSSSGSENSDDDIDSDDEMKDATPAQASTARVTKSSMIKPSLSTSGSSSDSDADDEEENAGTGLSIPAASKKPTVTGLVNALKRKASPSSSSSSESDSDSNTSSSARAQAVSVKKDVSSPVISQPQINGLVSKPSANSSSSSEASASDSESAVSKPAAATKAVAKTEPKSSSDTSSSESESADEAPKSTLITTAITKAEASPSSSSSESTSSDSESSEVDFSKPPKPTVTKTTKVVSTKPNQVSSDSSATLQATPVQKPSVAKTALPSTFSSDSSIPADPKTAATTTVITTTTTSKRKRSSSPSPKPAAAKFSKKQNTPFQRVPRDTRVDPKMASNAYRSYDYADRAHQDLSVTKGKGFTKEKNKKKRGSYKGGMIDVSGGKGVKFED
ncbi:SRP40, C-terminal domain-containing protein [Usnea florida]